MTTYSSGKQLTPFDYLEKQKNLPVDFLLSVFYVTPELQKKIPAHKIPHPFFESLEHVALIRKPLKHAADSLNHLLSHHDIDRYIEQNLLLPVMNIPVFRWLLTKYASIKYRDNNKIHLLTVTIGGMLYDLQQCKENGDAVATRVLDALKSPYAKPSTESGNNQSFLFKWPKFLKQLVSPAKDATFSDWMMQTDLPYTDEQSRYQRLSTLKKQGYQYKKDYTFTSYEIDKDGNTIPVSSNDIFQTEAEVQKALDADYSDLPDETSVTTSIAGTKFAGKTVNKISAFALSGMFFLSMINSGVTSSIPPRCETEGNCSPQTYQPLFNHNFTMELQKNATGHFKLAENITLNTRELPVFPNCSQPFSGILNTGSYAIHARNGTSPLFGCVDQAHIAGNINPCSTDTTYTQPVIANQLANESIVNVQQAGQCNNQRPLLGDISGNNNQMAFTGLSGNITVANNTGVVANSVSGNSNFIAAEGGHLLDAPVVSVAGGKNNTYQQQNMDVTRSAGDYQFDSKFLLAHHFSGNETTIIQNGINARFTIPVAPHPNIQNRNILDTQNSTITTFSTNTVIGTHIPENSIRLVHPRNRIVQPIVTNNGRAEVYQNGKWRSLCEDTFYQKSAHVICSMLGYKGAESEQTRAVLRGTLNKNRDCVNPPAYIKECNGNEQYFHDCKTVNTTRRGILVREALLSCFDETTVENTTLTDFSTDSLTRFDTTNTGRGRLEQKDLSGELHTVCATGFNNRSAGVACESMGYPGGNIDSTQVTPLPESVPILAFDWNCTGNETSLLQCPYKNLTNHNCTHHNDVVLLCNSFPANVNDIRLTDRQSTDDYRAVTTKTGLGRVEVYYQKTNSFMPFCIPGLPTFMHICRHLGFTGGGRTSRLIANPLPLPEYNNSYLPSIYCNGPPLICKINDNHGLSSLCPIDNNRVIFCYGNGRSITTPQIHKSHCPHTHKKSEENVVLFSGGFNPQGMNCELNQCPFTYWDTNSIQHTDFLDKHCRKQRLYTIYPQDWMKIWRVLCQRKQDNCSCHLPNEYILGIATQDNNFDETWVVSRQAYPNNNEYTNSKGLVRINKLFSGEEPKLLRPANEPLITKTQPVNQVVTEKHFSIGQHLLGLYSGTEKGQNTQLFWSSLNPDNDEYHIRTLSVNGEPILLTRNSVFTKNSQDGTMMQYEINTQINTHNMVEFDINISPEIIYFPDGIINIHTAAVDYKWLYVAGTNDTDANQVRVMRYNILTRLWDSDWEQTYTFNQNTRMFIDNYKRLHFLFPNQIPSTTTSVSLPDRGGCVLFSDEASISGEIIETDAPSSTIPVITTTSTTMLPTPTMTPEIGVTDGEQEEDKPGSPGGITAGSASAAAITGIGCACCFYLLKKHGCKNKTNNEDGQ